MHTIPGTRNITGTFSELFFFFIVSVIPVEIFIFLLTLSALALNYEYQRLAFFFGLLCLVFTPTVVTLMVWIIAIWIKKRRTEKSRLGMWLGMISPAWIFFAVASLLAALHVLHSTGYNNPLLVIFAAYYCWGVAFLFAISGLGSGFARGKIGGVIVIFEFILFVLVMLNE